MQTFAAQALTAKTGEVIDQAMAHPVQITRYRRPCVVILNVAEYERLVAAEAALKELQEGT